MAAIGGKRTRALVVAGKRARDGELAAAAVVLAFADDRRLGGRLRALLCVRLFFFFDDGSTATREMSGCRRRRGRSIVFLLEPAIGFFFVVTLGGFFRRLARIFLGLALFGCRALALQSLVFDGAILRIGVGALARIGFG